MNNFKNINIKSVWITWEHQRRSIELADAFEAMFYELDTKMKGLIRYLYLCYKTFRIIRKVRPKLLFVQSPSIILSAFAALYRKYCNNLTLVVDRHSNFFPITKIPFIDYILQLIADFAIRNSDITIVTNNVLKKVVERKGGCCVVLQDKLPFLKSNTKLKLAGTFNLLYPCSFDVDEPIFEVIKAATLIENNVHIYFTGNYHKLKKIKRIKIPWNVHLLGFVSDAEYSSYLASVNAVLALTKWDYTLLCCAYESVSLEKPMVLSNKKELKEYFYKGRILCDNSAKGIAISVKKLVERQQKLKHEIRELKVELSNDWNTRFHHTSCVIRNNLSKN